MAEPEVVPGVVVVTMPQMGETVTEGTVTAWLKEVGDTIVDDEPLLEISTDKVDSDVPAPADGVLAEILVAVGDTVAIGTPLAHIRAADGPADAAPVTAAEVGEADDQAPVAAVAAAAPATVHESGDEVGGYRSPVVRRLLAEHHVDFAGIPGSGAGGRVTRDDVLAAIEATPASGPATDQLATDQPATDQPASDDPAVEHVVFTPMRRTIAERMTASLATAAHTLVVVDVDYHRVAPAKDSAGMTWLPFIARAAIDALAAFPLINARHAGDGLDVHTHVHLGIAVDLDFEGLVVPVVHEADRLRLPALAEAIAERSAAARAKKVAPDEMAGGTFTITNAGRYGTLFTGPIINQPQVAILSTDGVKVRPVAVPLDGGGHGLAFHPVGNLALAFDHRAMDGAYASGFLARVRELIETRDWDDELGGRR